MIFLNTETTNKVVLTLTESSTLVNPNYLFKFVNDFDLDQTPIYFTTPDISEYPIRYNLFDVTLSSSGSTTGGTQTPLNLIEGQYHYEIYESSGSTLNIQDTTGTILEYGLMVVGDVTNALTDETNNTNPSNIYL